MSQDMNLLFKVEDYQIAQGTDEVNELLAKGYEPYGEPKFTEGFDLTDPDEDKEILLHHQAMVKREPFSPKAYVDVVKSVMLAMAKLQHGELADLFDEEERAEINKMFGEEVF